MQARGTGPAPLRNQPTDNNRDSGGAWASRHPCDLKKWEGGRRKRNGSRKASGGGKQETGGGDRRRKWRWEAGNGKRRQEKENN